MVREQRGGGDGLLSVALPGLLAIVHQVALHLCLIVDGPNCGRLQKQLHCRCVSAHGMCRFQDQSNPMDPNAHGYEISK